MIGKQSKQTKNLIVNLDNFIPENHLLKRIKKILNFDFIYDKVESLYSKVGRRSIDPVLLFKMLLIGYLYGIKSERRLCEEINLNIAYRWFCGLSGKVPEHSIFSKNRKRRLCDLNYSVKALVVERKPL